jgi:hypothetical protein
VIDSHEIFLGIDLLFFSQCLVVAAHGNALEFSITGLENFFGKRFPPNPLQKTLYGIG